MAKIIGLETNFFSLRLIIYFILRKMSRHLPQFHPFMFAKRMPEIGNNLLNVFFICSQCEKRGLPLWINRSCPTKLIEFCRGKSIAVDQTYQRF